METNIHIFEYKKDENGRGLMVRIFVNGSPVYVGSNSATMAVTYLFSKEINLKDIEVLRHSVVTSQFFDDTGLSYAELRERHPETTE